MFKNILIPVDLEEPDFARPAIEVAVRELDQSDGCIHLMTVIPGFASPLVASYFDPTMVQRAHEAVDQHLLDFAHKELPADIRHHLTVHQGHPAKRIVEQAEKIHADLIIMSAHHRGRVDHALLGSSSSRVVEHAHCSVMILRHWDDS